MSSFTKNIKNFLKTLSYDKVGEFFIMNDEILKKVEKKTKVKKQTIIDLARKLSNGNMKDEATINEVIDTLALATGKKVTPETKSKIINTIKDDKVPGNVDKMF